MKTYTFQEYPPNLKKKVILLEHFNSYLDGCKVNKDQTNQKVNEDEHLELGNNDLYQFLLFLSVYKEMDENKACNYVQTQ